jgi:hypothetical protein
VYGFGFALYLALSLTQAAALVAGLEIWLGIGKVSAAPVGIVLGFVPLAGTAVAVVGAIDGWAWPLGPTLAAFVAPLALTLVIAFHAGWRRGDQGSAGGGHHAPAPALNRSSSSR